MKAEMPILGDNGQGHNFYTLENCEKIKHKKVGSFKERVLISSLIFKLTHL